MSAMTEQDIVDAYEDLFLAMLVGGQPAGHVETQAADLTDEAYVSAIFDDVLGNPQRSLIEILTGGARGTTSGRGRYEYRRDPIIEITASKAFELDTNTLKHDPACMAAARALFTEIHNQLLDHDNIACGSTNRGVQVQSCDYIFDPRQTVERGEWACFQAIYKPVFINQIQT